MTYRKGKIKGGGKETIVFLDRNNSLLYDNASVFKS
jgi:hypothetical protein